MLWPLVFGIGATQATLLSAALWRRPVNPGANRVLAVWLALVAIDLTLKFSYLALPEAGMGEIVHIGRLLPLLYATLFFLYVRALTSGGGFIRHDAFHIVGFFAVCGAVALSVSLDQAPTPRRSWTPVWFDPVLFSWAAAYLFAAMLRVHRYRSLLVQQRSDADRMALRWVDLMAFCQLAIWGVAATHWLLRLPLLNHLAIYGAVVAWVCAVGWCSLAQPPMVTLPVAPVPGPSSGEDPRTDQVEDRLERLMVGSALYCKPALTIGQLARQSGYPEYLVSMVINRRFGGTFWNYVNHYRVDAARACLEDPSDTRSIIDIAYSCGFTSKSTFNASFKRIVGQTPSAYRRQSAAHSEISRILPD